LTKSTQIKGMFWSKRTVNQQPPSSPYYCNTKWGKIGLRGLCGDFHQLQFGMRTAVNGQILSQDKQGELCCVSIIKKHLVLYNENKSWWQWLFLWSTRTRQDGRRTRLLQGKQPHPCAQATHTQKIYFFFQMLHNNLKFDKPIIAFHSLFNRLQTPFSRAMPGTPWLQKKISSLSPSPSCFPLPSPRRH